MEKLLDIKTKKPFRRIRPEGYMESAQMTSGSEVVVHDEGTMNFDIVTQSDFLREYYPSGHLIFDGKYYPDIYRVEDIKETDEAGEETGNVHHRVYKELVPRFAFAFQQIISIKQIVHTCGNDIQFELNQSKDIDRYKDIFDKFRKGWMDKDMEVAFYKAIKSVKITGDSAIVGYLNDGKFGWMDLSFKNGDTLYPHYDPITGRMNVFARKYYAYDDDGDVYAEYMEVWDDKMFKRYKSVGEKYKGVIEKIAERFNLGNYKLITSAPHGFDRIPVAYFRDDDGPCWTPSQDSCDNYDMSYSQMAHNNQAYGEPILVYQGEDVEIQNNLNGTIKSITAGPDDKVSYLQSQSASESYMKQLDTLYKMIYEQSFTVIPPELRAGDLPAAALKILYSPAYEKAMIDSQEYQPFLNDIVEIFRYGYGVEMKMTTDFHNLPIKWWIKPYVHVNESSMVADIATAIQNGFMSKQTGSERMSGVYTTTAEWERIVEEAKRAQEADILFQMTQEQRISKEGEE